MAGDWIKVEDTLPDKPEVMVIADALGIDQDAVVGKLVRVWIWADQQTVDGNAVSVTRNRIDRLAHCPGFGEAMEKAGWVKTTNGNLIFPNFDRHNGETAKNRALTAKRVAHFKAQKGNAAGVTSALPREEKRRVLNTPPPPLGGDEATNDKPKKPPKAKPEALPPIPEALNTPEFLEAWTDWLKHRAERKLKVTTVSAKKAFAKMVTWGPKRAVAAINESIAQGWQGIYEAKGASLKFTDADPAELTRKRDAENKARKEADEARRRLVDAERAERAAKGELSPIQTLLAKPPETGGAA